MSYSFTCSQGHEPVTFGPVEAETDDEAVEKLMELAKPHLAEAHADMKDMTPEQGAELVKANMTKA